MTWNPFSKRQPVQVATTTAPAVEVNPDAVYGSKYIVNELFTSVMSQKDILDALKSLIEKEDAKSIRLGPMLVNHILVNHIFKDFNTAIDRDDINRADEILNALPKNTNGLLTTRFGICAAVERVLKEMIDKVKRKKQAIADQIALQQALGAVSPAGDVLDDMAREVQHLADQKVEEEVREKLRENQTKFIANSTTLIDLVNNLNTLSSITAIGGQANQFFIQQSNLIKVLLNRIEETKNKILAATPDTAEANSIKAKMFEHIIENTFSAGSPVSNEYGIRDTLIRLITKMAIDNKGVDMLLPSESPRT